MTVEHVYLSTACLHAVEPGREHLHRTCQLDTTRYDGTHKHASSCKYCEPPGSNACVCECHALAAGSIVAEPAPATHSWTTHGHHCCSQEIVPGGPRFVNRCMEPPTCPACAADVARIHAGVVL